MPPATILPLAVPVPVAATAPGGGVVKRVGLLVAVAALLSGTSCAPGGFTLAAALLLVLFSLTYRSWMGYQSRPV